MAEAIAIAGNAGRLFHMHFNDNYAFWDDDMIVGSIHSVPYLEMLYWLDRGPICRVVVHGPVSLPGKMQPAYQRVLSGWSGSMSCSGPTRKS